MPEETAEMSIDGPLRGFRIAVTADRRAREQIELFSAFGAEVTHAPTVEIWPLGRDGGLDVVDGLLEFDPEVFVATTGIGVPMLLDLAEASGQGEMLRDLLSCMQVVACGTKAYGAVASAGIPVSSRVGSIGELPAALNRGRPGDRRVAVQLPGCELPGLAEGLERTGFRTYPVAVYECRMSSDGAIGERLVANIAARRLDAVTFTSRAAVANLREAAESSGFGKELRRAFAGAVRAVCIGEATSAAAIDAGFGKPVVAETPRLGSLVLACVESLHSAAWTLDLAGVKVRCQGRVLAIGNSRSVELTDQERSVLDVLASRPGAVFSKAELLAGAWQADAVDEHVAEVAVARLRKRLGDAGAAVETVFKRGYRLTVA